MPGVRSVVGAGFIWQRRCQKNDRLFVRIDMKNQSSILAATNFHAALMKRKPPPLPLLEFRMAMRPMIKKNRRDHGHNEGGTLTDFFEAGLDARGRASLDARALDRIPIE